MRCSARVGRNRVGRLGRRKIFRTQARRISSAQTRPARGGWKWARGIFGGSKIFLRPNFPTLNPGRQAEKGRISRRFRKTADGRISDSASVAFLNLWEVLPFGHVRDDVGNLVPSEATSASREVVIGHLRFQAGGFVAPKRQDEQHAGWEIPRF